jgi:hypothetical protein
MNSGLDVAGFSATAWVDPWSLWEGSGHLLQGSMGPKAPEFLTGDRNLPRVAPLYSQKHFATRLSVMIPPFCLLFGSLCVERLGSKFGV